ncbi:MAG: penicillin acylase family protein, partial [Alphaproteobacteria bacterium]|nr:penicillin acylase family protein [Alphaproteobacteria bacterium]
GAAMIASDPHLPMTLPPVWLIAGMHAPGINAVGLMLPGLPFVALGRNPWIAWGGTNLHAASSELLDVSGEPFTERWETIRVRGSGARRIRLRESRLGPVVSDGALLRSATPLALRWAGHRPSDELSAMLAVARARDWEQFRAALAGFAVPGQNFLYAGGDGRVGRVLAVHVPRRGGKPGDLVAAPAQAAEWDELATARDHPVIVDPPEGIIASANQEPGGTTIPVGFFFSPADRAARMQALLAGNARITAADLQRMQMDVMHPGALAARDRLLRALPRPDGGSPTQVYDAIADWDGNYAADSRGAAAFELLFGHVAAALGAGDRLAPLQAVWTTRHLLLRELAGLPPARLDAVLAAAFARTARVLVRRRNWGALHRLRLRHPFARAPLLGRRYSFGEFPLAGGNETVFKTAVPLSRGRHYVGFGTCARHISDLADPDDNRFVLLGGQDGWLGSANFADQVALWRSGGYITVPLRVETARARFPHKTVLRPLGSAAGR